MSVASWVAVVAGVVLLLIVVVGAIKQWRYERIMGPPLRRLEAIQGENVFRLANLTREKLHLGHVTSSEELTPRDIESVARGLYAELHPDRPEPVGADQEAEMREASRVFRHFYVGAEGDSERVNYDRLVPKAMMILEDATGKYDPKLTAVAAQVMGTPLTHLKSSYATYLNALHA